MAVSTQPALISGCPTTKLFSCALELVIHGFHDLKRRAGASFSTSAFNNDLSPVGEKHSESWWMLKVEAGEELSCGKKGIQAKVRLVSPVEMSVKAEIWLTMYDSDHAEAAGLIVGSITDVELQFVEDTTQGTFGKRLYSQFIPFEVNYSDINASFPHVSTLEITADITFRVTAGGHRPGSPIFELRSMGTAFTKCGSPDCILVASDGNEFAVHKRILTKICPIFKKLFANVGRVELKDVDGRTLLSILRALYLQETWNPEEANKVLLAARKFKLAGLEQDAIRCSTENVTIQNAGAVLDFAKKHSVGALRQKVSERLVENMTTLSMDRAPEVLKMSADYELPKLKIKVASVLEKSLKTITLKDAAIILKMLTDNDLPDLKTKAIEILAEQVQKVEMNDAADVLRVLVENNLQELATPLCERIVENMVDFAVAGGYSKLVGQPDLIRLIEDEATQRKAKKARTV